MQAALAILAAFAATAGCRESRVQADASELVAPPARPAGCRTVETTEPLQPVLDDHDVSSVCLAAGVHLGPARIDHPVTVWGPPQAIIHTPRPGSTVEITGTGAALLGFTIDGAGGRFDQEDAAIRVASAHEIRIEGLTVIHAVFGIVVEQSERVRVIGNHVEGSQDPAIGLRGDTLRLWETRDSRVEHNVIDDGRDILIWYSRGNVIADNLIEGGRYGLHFMYSHDSRVERNQVLHAVVGVFAMYSRGISLQDNVIGGASGAAGMGIGLKESGDLDLVDNHLIRNTTGIYIDNSPLQPHDHLTIARNELRLNDRAITFHSSGHRVDLVDNDLVDNETQIQVDGGGDARDVTWHGNHFDDYAGYDLDGDGIGDVPYELRSLSNQLTSSNPGLALFRGTPALALVDAAAHLDPLYQPRPVLVDPEPRMAARWIVDRIARTPR